MHIPDGFLATNICAAFYTIMAPIWYFCMKKLRQILNQKTISFIAVFSALSFVIMMIHIPLPGGTSGHATGAPVMAITFGPYLATIVLSVVLFIQALIFGGGGILTFGVNAFCVAFALSFISWFTFKLMDKLVPQKKRWSLFISAWIATMVVAALTALVLGIQPHLAHDHYGHPHHFPFGIQITLPAMLLTHLFVGALEGLLTTLTITFLEKKKDIENFKQFYMIDQDG